MPREGVPYPERLLCSVRCELKNIWNALNGKLHSVNGVKGDGQGNVDIVSGDAAVVVTPQPLSNQVEISLDQSQLPAAAVTSVNNATGAVHLIGADIRTGVYSSGNSATQDILTARVAITEVNQNVTAEATARQNADNALQNNINNVTASLPRAAAAAVAADPTIASLVTADSQNVKLSGNQSIGGIKTVSTEATGTHSSQIANSQKVKNELDNYVPMVRVANNQTITGQKTFTQNIIVSRPNTGSRAFHSISTGIDVHGGSNTWANSLSFTDKNGVMIGDIRPYIFANGRTALYIYVYNSDGTTKRFEFAGDTI